MRCERVTIDDTPRAHREDRKGARAEGRAAVLRLWSIVPPTITTKGIFRVNIAAITVTVVYANR